MKSITLNTTSFSDQLGLYDFFNVLIYGTAFICGFCVLNKGIKDYLWSNITFPKGVGIVLLIYITGLVLQEIGSNVDRYITKIYKGTNRRILKGKIDKCYAKEYKENFIKNPILLEKYREAAMEVLAENKTSSKRINKKISDEEISEEELFDNDFFNGYFFSICQYTVSVKDKDRKVEKLRALFSMSKVLMSSFFLLAIVAVFTLILNADMSIEICNNLGINAQGGEHIIDKIIMIILFSGIGIIFYHRTKRTMKNFLLILLGTYIAIVDSERKEKA